MLGKTAGEVLMDILEDWGVEVIFGMPGDSINALMEPLRKKKSIRFIQVRHEEAGALAAAAYAKLTGTVWGRKGRRSLIPWRFIFSRQSLIFS